MPPCVPSTRASCATASKTVPFARAPEYFAVTFVPFASVAPVPTLISRKYRPDGVFVEAARFTPSEGANVVDSMGTAVIAVEESPQAARASGKRARARERRRIDGVRDSVKW